MKNSFHKKCSKSDLQIFIITYMAAFIINIQHIANELPFADFNTFSEMRISNYWELSLGRWMLPYLDHARWGVAGSAITSIMATFWLAIGAVLLVRLFKVNDWICRILICLLLAVAPFYYDILGSYHCSAEYILGFTLSILCVFCLYSIKNYYFAIVVGGFCLAASLGIYQAYLGISCGLCVLIPIITLLKTEQSPNIVLKKILQSIYMGISGVIMYLIVLFLNLKIWDWHLESYSGANEFGLKTILGIPIQMVDALSSFYQYFFADGIINNTAYGREVWHTVFFMLLLIIVLTLAVHRIQAIKRKDDRILFIVILIICLGAFSFALGVIEIIVPNRNINQLMCAPYILPYLFALSLSEFSNYTKIVNFIPAAGVLLVVAITTQSYFVMDNASSMATKMKLNQTKLLATHIIHTMTQKNDYYNGMPILFVGIPSGGYFDNSSDIYNMASGVTAGSGQIWGAPTISNNNWHHFIRYQLGMDLNILYDIDSYIACVNTKEFDAMPTYPAVDSIDVINGIMVIKLDENPAKE